MQFETRKNWTRGLTYSEHEKRRNQAANGKGLHMRSRTATSVLHGSPSKTSAGSICAGILFASFMTTVEPASALIPQAHGSLQNQVKQDSPITEVYVRRGGGVRRTTVVGPRGGVASRTVVRGGAVVRPGVVVRALSVRVAGFVRLTTTGVRAARSPPVPRLDLWPRPPRQPGRVRHLRLATAGTTPIQARRRGFGTSVGKRPLECAP